VLAHGSGAITTFHQKSFVLVLPACRPLPCHCRSVVFAAANQKVHVNKELCTRKSVNELYNG